MRFPKSPPFGWLAGPRRKATAGKVEEAKEDGRINPGETQAKVNKRRQLPSSTASCFSSCLPRCLRFGKRKAAEATDSRSKEEEREDIEDQEASTCLECSEVSRLTAKGGNCEVSSPLPMSAETPAFHRLFALGEHAVREEGGKEALPCFDKNDDSWSVEEVERDNYDYFTDKEGSNEGEEEMEWIVHIDENGMVTAGVSRICGGERIAMVTTYYVDDETGGAWHEEEQEVFEMEKNNMLMDQVEMPHVDFSLKFIGPAVPSFLCENGSKEAPGVFCHKSGDTFGSWWRSLFVDAKRVCFFASLLFKWKRVEQLFQSFAPNRREARFRADGEPLGKKKVDEKKSILPVGMPDRTPSITKEEEEAEVRSPGKDTPLGWSDEKDEREKEGTSVGLCGGKYPIERCCLQTEWRIKKKKKRKKMTMMAWNKGTFAMRLEPIQWGSCPFLLQIAAPVRELGVLPPGLWNHCRERPPDLPSDWWLLQEGSNTAIRGKWRQVTAKGTAGRRSGSGLEFTEARGGAEAGARAELKREKRVLDYMSLSM
ncbi:hypothetical protein CSUI_002170 [Cystoisospora suis]|uniref:Uncharacterized protein n=1 Tax=Cystoisospora suis TaxID=483139 RepID=A0A2C6KIW8_9APIC|nr:hypothetical protein CSUI_002170 [Cystoisospora suis]